MQCKRYTALKTFISVLFLSSFACATLQPAPAFTGTPPPTATLTPAPTNTPRPSPTPRPTRTPDLAATRHIMDLESEVQAYYEKGYLPGTDGQFLLLDDFRYEWAHLGGYKPLLLLDSAGDFFMSAHFKWDSALQTSNTSGCGFIFGLQPDDDHYAVFLDRQKVFFVITDHAAGYSKPISPTRGTGRVQFEYPAEADFTLIVKGTSAFVVVNGKVVGEYTLAQSRSLHGNLGLTVLSGTNKDYGTRCEMTNLHLWRPREASHLNG